MKWSELDRAFPETPQVFTERIDQTLRQLKEEKPVKRITMRAVLAAALITLLVAGIAYAAISLGQEWYFNNRFTAYQEHEPAKHQAIMDNLQKDIIQTISGEADKLVSFKVEDSSWSNEQKLLTLSISAAALAPDKDELHDSGELDQDGAFTDKLDPDNPESRTEHWLWTDKGRGLPKDTMMDPGKRLLLIDLSGEFYIGDSQVPMPMWMSDHFTNEFGQVMALYEFDLKQMEDEEINRIYAEAKLPEGMDQAEFEKNQQTQKDRLLKRAGEMREAVARFTDKEGLLSLRFPYKVFELKDNVLTEIAGGEAAFKVKTK